MEVSLNFTGKPEGLRAAIERVEKKLDSLERAAVRAEKAMDTIDFSQAGEMTVSAERVNKALEELTRTVQRLTMAKRAMPSLAGEMGREAIAARLLANEIDNLADQYRQLGWTKVGSWRGGMGGGGGSYGGRPGAWRDLTYYSTDRYNPLQIPYRTGGQRQLGPGPAPILTPGRTPLQLGPGGRDYEPNFVMGLADALIGDSDAVEAAVSPERRRSFWSSFVGALFGGRAGGAGIGRGGGGGGLFSTRSGYGIDPIGGFLSMGPGGRKATGEVLATAALGVGTVLAPMAPALGVLAAIPQAAAAVTAALVPLNLAFENVGKAIGGNKEAYKELTPEQKKFVDMVRNDLYPLLNGMRDMAAKGIMPGLTEGLGKAMNPQTINMVGGALQNLSGIIGELAVNWGEFVGRSDITDRLGRIFSFAGEQIKTWSDTLMTFIEANLVMMEGLRPLSKFLDESVNKGAKWLLNYMKAAEASGRFAEANSRIIESLRLVGGFALALLDALEGVYEVLAPLGRDLVPYLSEQLRVLADWLRANADEIRGPLIGAANAFLSVIQTLYPLLQGMYQVLSDIVGAVGGWGNAFMALIALNIAAKIIAISKAIQTMATAWTVAMVQMGGASIALGATIRAALITSGIGLLIVGFGVLAYWALTHWEEIKNAAIDTANAMTAAINGAINYMIDRVADFVNYFIDSYNLMLGWLTGNIEDWAPGHVELWGQIGKSAGAAYTGEIMASVQSAIQMASSVGVGGHVSSSSLTTIARGAIVGGGGAFAGGPGGGTHSYTEPVYSGGPAYDWQSDEAVDIEVTPSTMIQAVETGVIYNPHYGGAGGRTSGWSFYLRGESGNVYWYKHLQSVPYWIQRGGGKVKAGQVVGVGSTVGHLHFAMQPKTGGTPKVAIPKADIPSIGSAPAFPPDPKGPQGNKELAPLAMRIELAEAELTKRLSDDLVALNKIIKAVKNAVKGLTGEERLAGLQELKGYVDARRSIQEKMDKDLVGPKTIENLKGAIAKWASQFSDAFLKEHPRLAAFIKNRMAEINKLLAGEVTPAELERALKKFRDLKSGVEKIMGQIKEAMQRRAEAIRDAFTPIWERIADMAMSKFNERVRRELEAFDRMVEAWLTAFDARVAAYRTPSELAIQAIEEAAEIEGLQRNLEEAEKRLAEAREGKSEDFESQVLSAREILGRYELARKIERSQLAQMGGGRPTDISDNLIRDMRMALTPVFKSSLDDIEAATRAVEDAQRELNLYFLRGQAKKEREEFDKEMEAERRNWEENFAQERANLEAQLQKDQQVFEAQLAVIQAKLLAALIVGDEEAVNAILGDFKTLTGLSTSEMKIVREGIQSIAGIAGNQLAVLQTIANLLAKQAGQEAPYPNPGGEAPGGSGGGPGNQGPQGESGRTGGGGAGGRWMMMAKGGVIRGPFIAGEAGREAVIPLTDPRFNVGGVIVLPGRGGTSSTGGMGTNVTVVFEGDSALLEDFIKVKAVEASGGIGDALGRRSEERRRGGRF